MHRSQRRILLALATAVAVVAGMLASAAPAEAATSHHARFTFKYQAIDEYSKRNIIRGSGSSGDTLTNYYAFYWHGSYFSPKPKVTLQRKVGTKWATMKNVTVRFGKHFTVSAKLPAYTVPAGVASQKVLYRFHSTKSKKKHVDNSDYSSAYGVVYENPAMYTGFAAQMYGYLAPYCSTVAVHVSTAVAKRDHAGEFLWSRGITIDPAIANYTAPQLQGVALHECAHAHQFANFGKTARGSIEEAEAAMKIFVPDVNPDPNAPPSPQVGTFSAIEHAADCASHAVQPEGYLGYGGYCNAKELAAGGRLLTSSSRY
jgi:hypothetical protein